LQIRT
jgi:hypothetical protein